MTGGTVILGAGAWGQALGRCFANAGHDVAFWRRGEGARGDGARGDGARGDRSHALAEAGIVIAAVPAQATRAVLTGLAADMPARVPLVLTAKGLETGSNLRQSEIAAEICPGHPIAVLSGPSFAKDLSAGLPTAITLASTWVDAAGLQQRLATPVLRPYLTDDVTGAELGGALKNVIAIAAGVAIGAGLGESARASCVARGFAEMVRVAGAAGARQETLMGLSGLGDLTLTATSPVSRNYAFGLRLGAEGHAEAVETTEGRATARAAAGMAAELGVDAPLMAMVADLVDGACDVATVLERLTARPLRRE